MAHNRPTAVTPPVRQRRHARAPPVGRNDSDNPPDEGQARAADASATVKLLTIRQTAKIFGREPRTIRSWIARGVFDPVRVGRSVFIPWSQIEALIASNGTSKSAKEQ